MRELRNTIERGVSLGLLEGRPGYHPEPPPSTPLTDLASIVPLHLPLKEARSVWTSSFESIYVRSMLKKTEGNLTHAAELSGVNRRFMQRLVARLGLRAQDESE